ncbi:MAG: hypothetical protein H6908_06130 [Hyphomicrobiales bacterium]|nr:hypothetical protein [Hyphomicrobiales bacterium]
MVRRKRRGRPPSGHARHDVGTPELQRKRQAGLTTEPIDLCLQRELITPEQHAAALHLRWLFSLCYGVPSVRAVVWEEGEGTRKTRSVAWLERRAGEYAEALRILRHFGADRLVLQVCVYQQWPPFLCPRETASGPVIRAIPGLKSCERFTQALQVLSMHLERNGQGTRFLT